MIRKKVKVRRNIVSVRLTDEEMLELEKICIAADSNLSDLLRSVLFMLDGKVQQKPLVS